MLLFIASTVEGLPSASACSAQRLVTVAVVPSRRVWTSSPSQRPVRMMSALISASGRGNRVCSTADGVRPSASSLVQPSKTIR